MERIIIDTLWDRVTRYEINTNFEYLFKTVNNVVNLIIDEVVDEVLAGAHITWKEPVQSVEDLPAESIEGDTRMILDIVAERNNIYRYNGTEWVHIQEIDSAPIFGVENRVTSNEQKIAESGQRITSNDQSISDNAQAIANNAAEIITTNNRISSRPVRENEIKTTLDRYWSTETKNLEHTFGEDLVKIRTSPTSVKKTLVVFGSSTSEGFYSTEGNSWFDKLKDSLPDWDVLQRGWSGDTTTRAIGRFHKDVSPYNPDVCVIAFTLGNEGMNKEQTLTVKEEKYDQFKTNILTIAHLCKQNGIVPVIVDQSPTKRYDAEMYRLAAQLNKEFDMLGFTTVNFKGAIDALTAGGVPLNLAMHDDLHPNDAGHEAMFKSINPTMFKYISADTFYAHTERQEGYIRTHEDVTDSVIPIEFKPKVGVDSFTMFFRMKAIDTVVAQRTWASIGNDSLRISNQNNENHSLDLRGGGMSGPIISNIGLDDKLEHSVSVSFSSISKAVKFYVDGNLIGSDSSPNLVLTELFLAGRREGAVIGTNMAFKDLLVYRSRLSDEQINDMHYGFYTRGSLDIYAPMNDVPYSGGRLVNKALTDEYARVNSSQLTRIG